METKDPVRTGARSWTFGGRTFRLHKGERYPSRSSTRLHRAVWESANGKVPPGRWHVHHVNGDPLDNRIENLRILSEADHMAHHSRSVTPERAEARAAHMEKIRPLAAAWHRSEAGKAWHSKHASEMVRRVLSLTCVQCGEGFESVKSTAKYCHPNCKAAANRARRRAGVPKTRGSSVAKVPRTCPGCGVDYPARATSPAKRCAACTASFNATRKREKMSTQ